MSGHYYAYQYNDAFKPTQLRNWRYRPSAWPGKLPGTQPNRCCKPLRFIAGDNGHLYPNIPRNACSSPWGDYRTCIWETKAPCACIGKLRSPQFFKHPTEVPASCGAPIAVVPAGAKDPEPCSDESSPVEAECGIEKCQ